MTPKTILVLLASGAVAVGSAVYFVWLAPDDSPLFRVDAPERPTTPSAGPGAQATEAERGRESARPERRSGRPGRLSRPSDATGQVGFAPAPGAAARQAPGDGPGPSGEQPPTGEQPTDDQYRDSLTQLLERLDTP